MGNGCSTTLPLEVFTQKNFVADFIRLKLSFIQNKKSLLQAPFDGLGRNVRTPSTYLVGKPVVDLSKSKVGVFRRGWVTLSANFRRKGASPTNHCWCQKTRVIALSCAIKISTVHCLVLSQSTRVTDRQTDGQTELRQLT